MTKKNKKFGTQEKQKSVITFILIEVNKRGKLRPFHVNNIKQEDLKTEGNKRNKEKRDDLMIIKNLRKYRYIEEYK